MSLLLFDYNMSESILPPIVRTNDDYFNNHTPLRDDINVRKALLDIDTASYVNEQEFRTTRFGEPGIVTSRVYLSTGCKTALNVLSHPDVCFSLLECGRNASWWILQLKAGTIFLPDIQLKIPDTATCDILYKGKHFTELHELLFFSEEMADV